MHQKKEGMLASYTFYHQTFGLKYSDKTFVCICDKPNCDNKKIWSFKTYGANTFKSIQRRDFKEKKQMFTYPLKVPKEDHQKVLVRQNWMETKGGKSLKGAENRYEKRFSYKYLYLNEPPYVSSYFKPHFICSSPS